MRLVVPPLGWQEQSVDAAFRDKAKVRQCGVMKSGHCGTGWFELKVG